MADTQTTPLTLVAPNRSEFADRLLTPADVATWLQVSQKWLYDHTTRSAPIVPHLRLGGHLRFRRMDVEKWLDEQLETACA